MTDRQRDAEIDRRVTLALCSVGRACSRHIYVASITLRLKRKPRSIYRLPPPARQIYTKPAEGLLLFPSSFFFSPPVERRAERQQKTGGDEPLPRKERDSKSVQIQNPTRQKPSSSSSSLVSHLVFKREKRRRGHADAHASLLGRKEEERKENNEKRVKEKLPACPLFYKKLRN